MSASAADWLSVELVYALPERQLLLSRRVPPGTTLTQALAGTDWQQDFPGLTLTELTVGIWGKVEHDPDARVLCHGDRIEIYRPLTHDPKEARKARAARAKAGKAHARG